MTESPSSCTSLRSRQTTQSQLNQFPAREAFSEVEVAEGRNWLLPGGVRWFAGDLSEEEQRVVWATAMSPVHDLFDQKCEGVAWRNKPSWFVVAANDHTVHPELQRFASKRMDAADCEVDSSHVAMLSKPDVLLDVIRAAAGVLRGSLQNALSSREQDRNIHNRLQPDCPSR